MSTGVINRGVLARNYQAAKTWSSGGENYDKISAQIADAIEHCVDRLAPKPGEQILDVATGTGWTARRINSYGAIVTGIDLGEDVVAAARRLDSTGKIDFSVADAESLPYDDASFDAVVSTFGVMFAGHQEDAARELARVCKPGGRLALATWPAHGGVFDMFQIFKRYQPTPKSDAASPFNWGSVMGLQELLGGYFELKVEAAITYYREPSAEAAFETFATSYGPSKTLLSKLSVEDTEALKRDFIEFHEEHSTDVGVLVPRPYIIALGTRKAE